MGYQIRPGIVLTYLCGSPFLIPTRKAAQACPHILRLSLPLLSLWKALELDMPHERICALFEGLLHVSAEEADRLIAQSLQMLCEKGFLIKDAESQKRSQL